MKHGICLWLLWHLVSFVRAASSMAETQEGSAEFQSLPLLGRFDRLWQSSQGSYANLLVPFLGLLPIFQELFLSGGGAGRPVPLVGAGAGWQVLLHLFGLGFAGGKAYLLLKVWRIAKEWQGLLAGCLGVGESHHKRRFWGVASARWIVRSFLLHIRGVCGCDWGSIDWLGLGGEEPPT